MALYCSKWLFLKIFINGSSKRLSPISQNYNALLPFLLPSISYSNESGFTNQKLNRAMKAYLERATKYEELIKEQLQQYDLGKKHLANIIGKKGQNLTQAEIDESIEYLFPSGLHSPKARPIMKHPSEIFPEKRAVEFDYTGRPFHYLFYTTRPLFSEILHDAAKHLNDLYEHEAKMKKSGVKNPEKKLSLLMLGEWIKKEDLEKKLFEVIFSTEYEKFVEVFDRLLHHPYGYLVEDFIKKYRIIPMTVTEESIPKPTTGEDGTLSVHIANAKRKHTTANVTVQFPGEGHIQINHTGINYFTTIQSREQVSLVLKLDSVIPLVKIPYERN